MCRTGRGFIILTFVLMVPLGAILLLGIYIKSAIPPFLHSSKVAHEIFGCNEFDMKTRIVQYDDFWFVANFVPADYMFYDCVKQFATLMYGRPENIYNLENMYKDFHMITYTSYAVYLSKPEDLVTAINAMHYVRNCLSYRMALNRYTKDPDIHLVRVSVAFHLYFRTALLSHISIPKYVHDALKLPRNCYTKMRTSTEQWVLLPSNTDEEVQNHIVGYNAAQQFASQVFRIYMNTQTHLKLTIYFYFFNELRTYSSAKHQANIDWKKVIFRIPTFPLSNYQSHTNLHNNSDFLPNYVPYDTTEWLKAGEYARRPTFLDINDTLMACLSYFVMNELVPPLDYRIGINKIASDYLLLWRLQLDGYRVLMMTQEYVFHNTTRTEITLQNKLKSRDMHFGINREVIKEYEILFGQYQRNGTQQLSNTTKQ